MKSHVELCELYLLGQLSDDEVQQYEALLLDDADARAHFRQASRLAVLTRQHVFTQAAQRSSHDEIAAAYKQTAHSAGKNWIRVMVLASAAMLLTAILVTVMSDPAVGVKPQSELMWAARLMRSEAAVWDHDGTFKNGDVIYPGKLSLIQGKAMMVFRDGTRMNVHAGTTLSIIDESSAKLLTGRVTVSCPQEAIGFSLRTATAQIIDLGTAFGVRVDEFELTEVYVFEGRVECTHKNKQQAMTIEFLEVGQARRISPTGTSTVLTSFPPSDDFDTDFTLPQFPTPTNQHHKLHVHEPFDYSDPSLEHKNGGLGWASAWKDFRTNSESKIAIQLGAETAGMSGGRLYMKGTLDANRILAKPYDTSEDGVIYASILVRPLTPNEGRSKYNNRRQFFLRSSSEQSAPIGFKILDNIVYVYNQQWNKGVEIQQLELEHTYRLVMCLQFKRSGIDSMYATVLEVKDDVVTHEPITWPVSLAFVRRIEALYDYVSITSSGLTIYEYDDIRFGPSWESVTAQSVSLPSQTK